MIKKIGLLTALTVGVFLNSTSHASQMTDERQRALNRSLVQAARQGLLNKMQGALDQGAQVNVKSCLGTTPLHAAVSHLQSSAVVLLLERGANVEATTTMGQTPLHLAAFCRAPEAITKTLIEYGSCVNARDTAGNTPLHLAAGEGATLDRSSETARVLLPLTRKRMCWH